jgi:LPXTG-motif cell wall-anchored protein
MAGKVIFLYEDASGNQQRLEKEFNLQVMEMPIWEEPPFPGEEVPGESSFPWIPVLIGVVLLAAIGGFLLRRRRKKKMHQELEINE